MELVKSKWRKRYWVEDCGGKKVTEKVEIEVIRRKVLLLHFL